jgi:iron-sulfur cluster assembly protein
MITATQAATVKIAQQIQNRGKGLGIRIGVRTTGCSGMAYVLEFVDSPSDEDQKLICGDYAIYVDPKAQQYIDGMTVDYTRQGLNEGFEFINPNEASRCGCGESFSV